MNNTQSELTQLCHLIKGIVLGRFVLIIAITLRHEIPVQPILACRQKVPASVSIS
jgi:hypothetical protein